MSGASKKLLRDEAEYLGYRQQVKSPELYDKSVMPIPEKYPCVAITAPIYNQGSYLIEVSYVYLDDFGVT